MGGKPATPVLVGPFPGPVHGVSVINAALAAMMAARGLGAGRIDLSPGARTRGLAYHATRAARALLGFARILAAPLSDRHRYIMSIDGGAGMAYNIALALAARLTGQALLLYHHSTRYVLADSRPMRMLVAIAGRDWPHVFCSTQMAALFRARYGAAGPVMIVSNVAWVDQGTPGDGTPGGVRLGFLSTLTVEKGLGRVFATLRACRGRGLNAELVLAGPVVDAQARALVRQAQAEFGPALGVRGLLAGADKAGFYGSLDVFLFPSLYPHETQSLVVPEALAAGTPVIAYDHRFVGEMLGQAGLLVPVAEDFADQAADFIAAGQEEGVRQARRAAARAQYETERARADGQIERLIAWATGRKTP